MRSVARWMALGCVAASLLGGCGRKASPSADAGAPDTGPRRPEVQEIRTRDNWRLAGTLYPGAASTSQVAVLLLHQLGSNRGEWGPLVERLQQPPAVTVLTLDLRGHGDSTRGPSSDHQTWEGFGEDPQRWEGLATDARAGAQLLMTIAGARSLAAVGSSIGGSAALAGLADDGHLVGLALVSPGTRYHGLDALAPMRTYATTLTVPPRTAWMTLGGRDAESARSLPALLAEATGIMVNPVVVTDSEAHGVSLLVQDPTGARWNALDRYVRAALRVPQGSPRGRR